MLTSPLRIRAIAAPLLALLVANGCASTSGHRVLESNDPALAPLGFLAGSWISDREGTVIDEHWTHASGGTMYGVSRTVKQGRTVFMERMAIEARGGELFFEARLPGGDTTAFRLVRTDGGRFVFENPEHDFPTRVIYWLDTDGSLRARIEGTQDGEPSSVDFHYQRATLAR